MINLVGVMGDTGYGKSMSFIVPPDGNIKENEYNGLNPRETLYFSFDQKPLPFQIYTKKFPKWKESFTIKTDKGDLDWFKTNVFQTDLKKAIAMIKEAVKRPNIKHIILDTISVAMHDIRMQREREKTFDKWSDLGILVYELFKELRLIDRPDLYVWWFAHTETEKSRENITTYKAKIEGSMLDKFLEKWTTNVFFATKNDDKYLFETQANNSTAKNPPLLFKETIPNSLQLIYKTLSE